MTPDETVEQQIEALAEYAHWAWSGWMRHLFAHWDDTHIAHWKRQMETSYAELSDLEKESDRREAREMLRVLRDLLAAGGRPLDLDVEQMRGNLHITFNGGWQSEAEIRAFHHGMDTVCNVLDAYLKGESSNGILPLRELAGGPASAPKE